MQTTMRCLHRTCAQIHKLGPDLVCSTKAQARDPRVHAHTTSLLVLAAIYLVCILAVDPRGEFPLNDDWSYTRSAFRLAQDAKLTIDPWAAPSVVGQALYGAALARAFGSKFLVLRLSTLALACGLAWILWTLLARVGADTGLVRVAVLTWLFVVVTGNHWWLDGIVAVGVLAVCAWGVFGVRTAWRALRQRLGAAAAQPEALEPEPALT